MAAMRALRRIVLGCTNTIQYSLDATASTR
jgi:hypothetical protein